MGGVIVRCLDDQELARQALIHATAWRVLCALRRRLGDAMTAPRHTYAGAAYVQVLDEIEAEERRRERVDREAEQARRRLASLGAAPRSMS